MRLSGIASGFDTESMVQQLMNVERMKVNRFEQQKQVNLWTQQKYAKINKSIANFIINTKKDFGIGFGGMNFDKLDYIKKASITNDKIADVKVTGSAGNGSFDMEVEKLAESDKFVSDKVGLEDTFNELEKPVYVNGVKISNGEVLTNKELIKKINDNPELKKQGFSAFYDNGTGRMFIQSDHSEGGIKITHGESLDVTTEFQSKIDIIVSRDKENASITIDGVSVGISKKVKDKDGNESFVAKSIEEIVKDINSNGDLKNKGISAEVDKDGKIKLYSAEKGNFEIDDDINTINISLNKDTTGAKDLLSGKGDNTSGNNAKVKINGIEIDSKGNKINFNGVEINLKETTGKGSSVRIEVNTDVAPAIEKIENFVKGYNDLIDEISEALGEKRYNSYKPLSKEEKESMKEKDIDLWEEKAQSGLLSRDATLNRILSGTRSNLYKDVNVDGKGIMLTELGISTQKYSQGAVGGKLEIDMDKLKRALEDNPENVMKTLFKETKAIKDKNGKEVKEIGEQGVFTRIYDSLMIGMKEIVNKSGPGGNADLIRSVNRSIMVDFTTKKGNISDMEKSVLEMNKRIDSMNALLVQKESSYYAKFTAMEKYVYKMNSQSNWIGQQMM